MNQEGIIRVLPPALANKIAAGEVVQRPSSAAKELIENAIDAGADAITVVLKKAGSELIQVVDNGCGMGPADAAACFERHATSKIASDEDLERIYTLGFRGEALASIAAVAQVELRTKRAGDDVGVSVRMDGGAMHPPAPCATPSGTSLSVRNLFYNVPARRNFLKSPATEFKHLVETFQFLALSNPEITFTLVHDGAEVYRLPAAPGPDALRRRIADLFGDAHFESLIPVAETTSYLSIEGFAGRPEFSRKQRAEQFCFVNGRFIKNRNLEHAVASAYGEMLPKGAFPFFALFLRLDPRHVDVNVHPTKMEVKFDDERGVYGFVRTVVKKAIGSVDIAPSMAYDARGRLIERPLPAARPAGPLPAPDDEDAGLETRRGDGGGRGFSIQDDDEGFAFPPARGGEPAPRTRFSAPIPGGRPELPEEPHVTVPAADAPPPGRRPADLPPSEALQLWQLQEKYLLTRTGTGLMILDQHAAHERILYEKALRAMERGRGASQQLLFPHTITLAAADFGLVQELLDDLRALGFDVEPLSGRSVLVRGVPADVRTGDENRILEEIVEQYRSYRDTLQIRGRDNLAKSLACRAAIKTGQRLTTPEMQALLDQLFACDMPYACPHGRPILIKIPVEELDKRFGRVGHLERE